MKLAKEGTAMDIRDQVLLQQFAKDGSEDAFREIVDRYTGMVYSAAYRSLGDYHRAQDAAQAAFIILARKAGKLGKDTILASWLWRTVSLVCRNMKRDEARRKRREAAAVSTDIGAGPVSELAAAWAFVEPHLDTAMAGLSAKSRDALIGHFFMGKSSGQIAVEQGIKENTAAMRVNYGVKKLRERLAAMGVKVSGGLLLALLGAKTAEAVPVGLAEAIHGAALGAAAGSAVSGAGALIAEKALKAMLWAKIKLATVLAVTAAVAVGVAAPIALKPKPAKKWHPGYYITFWDSGRARDTKTWLRVLKAEPLLQGVRKRYPWRLLEPAKGVYDLTAIEDDLRFLAALDKRLVVQLQDKWFGEGGGEGYIPDYIQGPAYGGGVYRNARGAVHPVRWNAAVAERLVMLSRALGERFDAEPHLEAVIVPQTCLLASPGGIDGQEGIERFDMQGYIGSYKRQLAALADVFPHTVVILHLNYLRGEDPRPYEELARYAAGLGVGIGDPNMGLYEEGVQDRAYHLYPKLAGQVPLAMGMPGPLDELRHPDGSKVTVRQLLCFARNELHLNYLFIQYRHTDFDSELRPALRQYGHVLERRVPARIRKGGVGIEDRGARGEDSG
ncbi:MAG: sigma-70 family RNA polymerase sigma factor [Kiritimatiellae bacterium]|nr:sigma-70 family RNA polymerase sigma factor [Kiritimatiellia bacterium]